MLEQVRSYMQSHHMVSPGDLVIVAVSGGPDSVALLSLLYRMAPDLGIRLHVFHLDHGLRGEDSQEDALYVHALAERWGLPCTVVGLGPDVIKRRSGSLQANARAIRYEELDRLGARLGAASVAVAQHRDDQAETVLMRLLRGTGLRGLAGIAPVRTVGRLRLIRPLLTISRASIEQYCQDRELFPRLDASNLKRDYLRNRIRLSLLPSLAREYNPAIAAQLAQMAEVARVEDDYLDSLVDSWVQATEAAAFVPAERLHGAPTALARRAVRLAARRVMGEGYELGLPAVTEVLGLAAKSDGTRSLDFHGGLRVVTEYGSVRMLQAQADGQVVYPGEWPVNLVGETDIPELGLSIQAPPVTPPQGPYEILLDLDSLPGPLTLRFRRPGDRMWPTGMEGSKKLQDILVDAKVPQRQRDRVPVLTAGDEVVWLVGHRFDRRFLAGQHSEKTLLLRVLRTSDNG